MLKDGQEAASMFLDGTRTRIFSFSRDARRIAFAAALAAVGAAALSWWTLEQRGVARRNAALSQAALLVSEARYSEERPVKSLLLASAAVEVTRRRLSGWPSLAQARQALRWALITITAGWRPQALPDRAQGARCEARLPCLQSGQPLAGHSKR